MKPVLSFMRLTVGFKELNFNTPEQKN